MKGLKETLQELGFSKELAEAIDNVSIVESQEEKVEDVSFQTFENNVYNSTDIKLFDDTNNFNYYGIED